MLDYKVVHIGHDVVLRLLHRLEELVGKLGTPLIARIATGLALDAHARLVGDAGVERGVPAHQAPRGSRCAAPGFRYRQNKPKCVNLEGSAQPKKACLSSIREAGQTQGQNHAWWQASR